MTAHWAGKFSSGLDLTTYLHYLEGQSSYFQVTRQKEGEKEGEGRPGVGNLLSTTRPWMLMLTVWIEDMKRKAYNTRPYQKHV